VTEIPVIETARLRLRPLTDGDVGAWHATVLGDPEATRYLPTGAPIPIEEVRGAPGRIAAHWERYGYGTWAVEDRATREFLGDAGLRFVEEAGETEVLYGFSPKVWNRGIGTEAARAALDFGFERTDLQRIVAFAVPANVGSTRVMEKIGMRFEAEQHIFGLDTVRYAISRDEGRNSARVADRPQASRPGGFFAGIQQPGSPRCPQQPLIGGTR
jgi:RimJ/RimL family protein N-acetyltransferase